MSALQKYVARQPKGAISALARNAGVTHAQMSRIISGQRGASLDVAMAISRATGGIISVADVAEAKRATASRNSKTPARSRRGRA